MVNGTTVDNTVVGGPAFNSKQFCHGDVILAVNGVPATNDNLLDLLIGSDIPGTSVEIRVAKGHMQARKLVFEIAGCDHMIRDSVQGPLGYVKLNRMANNEIRDRRRMFEYFNTLKVLAPAAPV
jgi:C-terminal processing protease CtpA/Prc